MKNGANINGATNSALTLVNITWANNGSYTVLVSNSGGNVLSSAATLAVRPAAVTGLTVGP
jgi:hypothetical protein